METDFLETLYPVIPHAKPPGDDLMLRLIAYDIASPKRLRRVAETCEDFGVRVQLSLFECWLEDQQFQELWSRLNQLIVVKEDRLLAYTLEGGSARRRLVAGAQMAGTEKPEYFIV